MDAIEAIFTRRSIRKYKATPVPPGTIRRLVEMGMQAPSARDFQPWHFIIIDDRSILDKIPTFHPYAEMTRLAPAAIVVAGDLNIEHSIDYINQDCSAATQNMLIGANALGLGAVWLGIYPREKRVQGMRDLLKLPAHIVPVSTVVLGVPDEVKPPVKRFKAERLHHNVWSTL